MPASQQNPESFARVARMLRIALGTAIARQQASNWPLGFAANGDFGTTNDERKAE